ncbi:MAG: hypothetical protein HQK53_15840 [Oligoflexia bacterium]|nr:hypothetical protein [Oligoflexia bacterium]
MVLRLLGIPQLFFYLITILAILATGAMNYALAGALVSKPSCPPSPSIAPQATTLLDNMGNIQVKVSSTKFGGRHRSSEDIAKEIIKKNPAFSLDHINCDNPQEKLKETLEEIKKISLFDYVNKDKTKDVKKKY